MSRAPQTPPELSRASDELAQALLPGIMRHLEATTARFVELERTLARAPRGGGADGDALLELEHREGADRGIGWSLGVLAAAGGCDLLLARRERDGVRFLCERVEEALLDRTLAPSPAHLPTVVSGKGRGWEVPFLAAYLFLAVGARRPRGRSLAWSTAGSDTGELRLVFVRERGDTAGLDRVAGLVGLVPGATVVDAEEHVGLALPRAWVGPPAALR